MSINTNDRLDLIKRIFAGVTITLIFVFAIIGFVYVTLADQLRRDIHNAAVCDEACASMEQRNMNQLDSCWCGDDLHSDHVIPLAWKFKKGEFIPTVKNVELDVGN
jgi:hypothetical protein